MTDEVHSWEPATAALRTLGLRMMERDARPDLVDRVRDLLTEAIAVAEEGGVLERFVAFPGDPVERQRFLDRSMMVGGSNMVAPPVDQKAVSKEETIAHVTVPRYFEGPPGRVHGGFVAALMDHIVGTAAVAHIEPPYYTRMLTTNYDDAVPIEQELILAARLTDREGRKCWMDAEIRCGGTVRATARALMIQARAEPAD